MKIRNTLVWRGLPGDRTEAAPRVTEYITDIRDGDPFLRDDCELVLPGRSRASTTITPRSASLRTTPTSTTSCWGPSGGVHHRRHPGLTAGGHAGGAPPRGRRHGRDLRVRRALAAGAVGVADGAVRHAVAAAVALPLPVRHRVLPARREHHRHPRRGVRADAARREGLRRRREHLRPTSPGVGGSGRRPAARAALGAPNGLCQFYFCGLFVGCSDTSRTC